MARHVALDRMIGDIGKGRLKGLAVGAPGTVLFSPFLLKRFELRLRKGLQLGYNDFDRVSAGSAPLPVRRRDGERSLGPAERLSFVDPEVIPMRVIPGHEPGHEVVLVDETHESFLEHPANVSGTGNVKSEWLPERHHAEDLDIRIHRKVDRSHYRDCTAEIVARNPDPAHSTLVADRPDLLG